MLFSILPPAARQIGISPFQVSTIFATSASIWVFVSPWWGRRSDVKGRRAIILTGLLGYALSMTLLASTVEVGIRGWLAPAVVYPLLIASRCVFALIGSGTGPASQGFVADHTSRADRVAAVALVSAAMGLGETVGPGIGAALATIDLLAPIYFSAALAVVSALTIWRYLPEDGLPNGTPTERPPKMRVRDRRVLPFLIVSISLQAVRATTVIILAFYFQDTLHLNSQQTVQYSGVGFVILAVSGLIAQLVLVQRYRPSATLMLRAGVILMLTSFLLFVIGNSFPVYLAALSCLGVGVGLVRPGSAAAASLAVSPYEQGSVAGMISGVAVIGNVVAPMVGTTLYEYGPDGPFYLNSAIMAAMLVLVFASARVRSIRA